MPESDESLPQLLSGRYRLEAQLGHGGMGVVYRATDLRMKRAVAVKLVRAPEGETMSEEVAGRFLREAKHTARLKHENIIEIFDLGRTDGGDLYFIMELLEGEPLSERLKRDGRYPIDGTVHVGRQICAALHAAHSAGIIHRDLKPANVMLLRRAGDDQFVKVLDFGVAKSLGIDQETQLTANGMLVGTLDYMAPEQITGKGIDGRADMYSLGVLLYRMLAGRPPFRDAAAPAMINAHLNTLPPSIRDAAPEVPPSLERVVLRCLAKRAEDRYGSMEELAAALLASLHAATPAQGTGPVSHTNPVLSKPKAAVPLRRPANPYLQGDDTEIAAPLVHGDEEEDELLGNDDATVRVSRPRPKPAMGAPVPAAGRPPTPLPAAGAPPPAPLPVAPAPPPPPPFVAAPLSSPTQASPGFAPAPKPLDGAPLSSSTQLSGSQGVASAGPPSSAPISAPRSPRPPPRVFENEADTILSSGPPSFLTQSAPSTGAPKSKEELSTARRPVPEEITRIDRTEGHVCAMCQMPNAPYAATCHACGVSLSEADQAAVRMRVQPTPMPPRPGSPHPGALTPPPLVPPAAGVPAMMPPHDGTLAMNGPKPGSIPPPGFGAPDPRANSGYPSGHRGPGQGYGSVPPPGMSGASGAYGSVPPPPGVPALSGAYGSVPPPPGVPSMHGSGPPPGFASGHPGAHPSDAPVVPGAPVYARYGGHIGGGSAPPAGVGGSGGYPKSNSYGPPSQSPDGVLPWTGAVPALPERLSLWQRFLRWLGLA